MLRRSSLSPYSYVRNVSGVFLEPAYDPFDDEFKRDIALLKLERPALLSGRVAPACLPEPNNVKHDVTAARRCVVLGWGYTVSEEV